MINMIKIKERLMYPLLNAWGRAGGDSEDATVVIARLNELASEDSVKAGLKKVALVPTLVDIAPLVEEPRNNKRLEQQQPSRAAVLEILAKESSPPYSGGQSY